MKKILFILLIAGTVGAVGAATVYARSAADADRQREIAEANLEAARDTITRYTDSITTTTSLMQQQGDVAQDSIVRLLETLGAAVAARDQTLRSIQTMQLEFARLEGSYASARVRIREDSVAHEHELAEGEAEAEFEVLGPPIDGSLTVTYRPEAPWTLQTDLGVTPFALTYSVGCQGRAPVVNITTPSWVSGTPEAGVIAPDVCNPVKPRGAWSSIFRVDISNSIWFTLGGIAGYFIGREFGGETIREPYYECPPEVCYVTYAPGG